VIPGTFHYFLINWQAGFCVQTPLTSPLDKPLQRRLVSIGIDTLLSKNITIIRNEKSFQFTYDLIFFSSQNRREALTNEFVSPKYEEEFDFS
jgi:hypothetical protein